MNCTHFSAVLRAASCLPLAIAIHILRSSRKNTVPSGCTILDGLAVLATTGLATLGVAGVTGLVTFFKDGITGLMPFIKE